MTSLKSCLILIKRLFKCGKPLRFAAAHYCIRIHTVMHIKVFACSLHKIISFSCILTLLQTNTIEIGLVKMLIIIMAYTDTKTVQFTNKLAFAYAYYFANNCY